MDEALLKCVYSTN